MKRLMNSNCTQCTHSRRLLALAIRQEALTHGNQRVEILRIIHLKTPFF